MQNPRRPASQLCVQASHLLRRSYAPAKVCCLVETAGGGGSSCHAFDACLCLGRSQPMSSQSKGAPTGSGLGIEHRVQTAGLALVVASLVTSTRQAADARRIHSKLSLQGRHMRSFPLMKVPARPVGIGSLSMAEGHGTAGICGLGIGSASILLVSKDMRSGRTSEVSPVGRDVLATIRYSIRVRLDRDAVLARSQRVRLRWTDDRLRLRGNPAMGSVAPLDCFASLAMTNIGGCGNWV